jgi:hypothetical protein
MQWTLVITVETHLRGDLAFSRQRLTVRVTISLLLLPMQRSVLAFPWKYLFWIPNMWHYKKRESNVTVRWKLWNYGISGYHRITNNYTPSPPLYNLIQMYRNPTPPSELKPYPLINIYPIFHNIPPIFLVSLDNPTRHFYFNFLLTFSIFKLHECIFNFKM